jgi:hypothetical protein
MGVHCSDPLVCDPGAVATALAQCSPSACYTKNLCEKQVACRFILDGGTVDAESVDAQTVDAETTEADARTAEDARNTTSPDTAECYPGQVSECTWTPTYDPCRFTTCMGYSTFCSNGRWQAVHCETVTVIDAGPRLSVDVAAERGSLDLQSDASAIDSTPALDGTSASN